MAGTRGHAIVLGGSMAGLGAARALANHFDRVTLVERDELTTGSDLRKGVPQAQHAHGLLPSGYQILSDYFPGLMDELVAQGAIRGDLSGDFLWYQYGGWKLRADSGLEAIVVSRPFLERKVRDRVLALPKVTLLQGHIGESPVFDSRTRRVTGLSVKELSTGTTATLDADLVVDALGRGSPSPKWLASWGYGQVTETNVPIEVGYATGVFERRAGDLYGVIGAVIAGTAPQSTRFAAILGAEGNRWIVTLAGCLRDYPPTDFSGWKAFAGSLPTPDALDLVKDREPIGPIASYRIPGKPALPLRKARRAFPAATSLPATPSAASIRSTDRACPWRFRKRTPSIAASPPAMAIWPAVLPRGRADRREPVGDRDRRGLPLPAGRRPPATRIWHREPLHGAGAPRGNPGSRGAEALLPGRQPAGAAAGHDGARDRVARVAGRRRCARDEPGAQGLRVMARR